MGYSDMRGLLTTVRFCFGGVPQSRSVDLHRRQAVRRHSVEEGSRHGSAPFAQPALGLVCGFWLLIAASRRLGHVPAGDVPDVFGQFTGCQATSKLQVAEQVDRKENEIS